MEHIFSWIQWKFDKVAESFIDLISPQLSKADQWGPVAE